MIVSRGDSPVPALRSAPRRAGAKTWCKIGFRSEHDLILRGYLRAFGRSVCEIRRGRSCAI